MDARNASVLLQNLLSRMIVGSDGSRSLPGRITDDEVKAIQSVLGEPSEPESEPSFTGPAEHQLSVSIDDATLGLPPTSSRERVCLDFGTAMSKATLIRDGDGEDAESIQVLALGVPGDQEEVSDTMLVSSVFIDGVGRIWFGQAAIARSESEGADGSRQRLDSIKRRLSEDGIDERLPRPLNPTGLDPTYREMVLAYLVFLTWTVNRCCEDAGAPRNVRRRFAMPCFEPARAREVERSLRQMLGRAQVLADTFGDTLVDGMPLERFLAAARSSQLAEIDSKVQFIDDAVTEPLGVAVSRISLQASVSSIFVVMDVGAGTTDFSLYRIAFDPESGASGSREATGSSQATTIAGNQLDGVLAAMLLANAGLGAEERSAYFRAKSALDLRIRNLKESLFDEGFVATRLVNGANVEITLEEFLSSGPVREFGAGIASKLQQVLESVNHSWIEAARRAGQLAVVVTGGGARLPMIRDLANGSVDINGRTLRLVQSEAFPPWLRMEHAHLEDAYERIAVSLGGARRIVILRGGPADITAGDVGGTPELQGYYTKGPTPD